MGIPKLEMGPQKSMPAGVGQRRRSCCALGVLGLRLRVEQK